jgi:hypothetical protein
MISVQQNTNWEKLGEIDYSAEASATSPASIHKRALSIIGFTVF